MSKLGYFAAFALGAAAGAIGAWKILKDKYEERTNAELQSIRAAYNGYDESECEEEKKEELNNYIHVLKTTGYNKPNKEEPVEDKKEQKGGEVIVEDEGPYIIGPDEFGELGYQIEYLTYYNDGVIASDMNDKIDDADELLGCEFPKHFGEFGNENEVIVRNDKLGVDYEITYDPRDYSDTQGSPDED